jgi:HAD superfamily hydrolase (TIGR01459 family)
MSHAPIVEAIGALSDVSQRYDALFCDVWGVVHDGVRKSPEAEAALVAARKAGTKVILITNSPRLSRGVIAQLDALDVTREAYDGIVTSGDATRTLIERAEPRIFHIGPSRDRDIFEGLNVEFVAEEEAAAIVATGLFDDEAETPADYAGILERAAARDVEMICANPDIVVHRGERLIYCAGALGQAYAELGGTVRLAGKPHRPIYEVAVEMLGIASPRILCIGDGMFTDVKGGATIGADVLFVQEGIHRDELAHAREDMQALHGALAERELTARYVMPALR